MVYFSLKSILREEKVIYRYRITMKDNEFVVDRIEDRSVVLQNNKEDIIIIDISNVKETPKEGDILIKIDKNKYIIDSEETKSRRSKIQQLMKGMWVE